MIAKIVSHTRNMHTIRPSVQPALRRLVTTNWLVDVDIMYRAINEGKRGG